MATTATISFLGTGSGFPSADRFFSSTILHLGGCRLLLDAGEPCIHLLRDRNIPIEGIDAILITHGHVDHIGGIPAFLQGAMLMGRRKPLPIHLPEEMIAPLRAWIGALYLTEEGFGFPVLWKAWEHGVPEILDGGISVTPHANTHLEQAYRTVPGADPLRPCGSYSFEILQGDFRAVFSGDLARADELSTLLSIPTTLLVSELSHFSPEELGAVLSGAPVTTLCLVHLSEEYVADRSELRVKLEEMLPQIRDVFLPEDGEVLDF